MGMMPTGSTMANRLMNILLYSVKSNMIAN
jgi:hypothetical protein